jgi:hypothetical protein
MYLSFIDLHNFSLTGKLGYAYMESDVSYGN